jgi:hypothetical protein
MAAWRCAAGVPWRLEIAENAARKGRERYAHGLGKAPKDQVSSYLYKDLSLSDLRIIRVPFGTECKGVPKAGVGADRSMSTAVSGRPA